MSRGVSDIVVQRPNTGHSYKQENCSINCRGDSSRYVIDSLINGPLVSVWRLFSCGKFRGVVVEICLHVIVSYTRQDAVETSGILPVYRVWVKL